LGGNGLSAHELRSLPAAFPFDPVVPAAFGIGRSAAYRALAAGQLPIKPLRLGRKLIVRRADLLSALGIEDPLAAAEHPKPQPDAGRSRGLIRARRIGQAELEEE
jgi:hypothetical protein